MIVRDLFWKSLLRCWRTFWGPKEYACTLRWSWSSRTTRQISLLFSNHQHSLHHSLRDEEKWSSNRFWNTMHCWSCYESQSFAHAAADRISNQVWSSLSRHLHVHVWPQSISEHSQSEARYRKYYKRFIPIWRDWKPFNTITSLSVVITIRSLARLWKLVIWVVHMTSQLQRAFLWFELQTI